MSDATPVPLVLRGCAVTALHTGEEATNLRELRESILRIPERSLYYHFWGRLLRPVLVHREYVNDFGNWVGHQLRHPLLAERLALVDPGDRRDCETLRTRVVDLLDAQLFHGDFGLEAPPDEAFHFLEGQMVIFDTNTVARDPAELTRLLPSLPPSSVFYHLVDARHRPAHGRNDFQEWLEQWGERYAALAEAIGAIDVYFTSLVRLKEDVVALFEAHIPGAIA